MTQGGKGSVNTGGGKQMCVCVCMCAHACVRAFHTFHSVQHSVVQGLSTGIVGRGADSCPTAIGQSVSMETTTSQSVVQILYETTC